MKPRRLVLVASGLALASLFALSATAAAPFQDPQDGQGEEEANGYQFLDEDDIRRAIEETLSQPDFARLRAEPEEKEPEPEESKLPDWLDRFLRWLSELGRSEEKAGSTPDLSLPVAGLRMLLFAMAILILAAAIVFIVKSALASARDRKIEAEQEAQERFFRPGAAPGEVPPEEYWRRALTHGEARRYKEGIRDLLLGAMSTTERRGLIRFRKGLTNRDYFYSVRGPARNSFARIASSFELVYFGRRQATSDAFRECCREYQKSFGGATP